MHLLKRSLLLVIIIVSLYSIDFTPNALAESPAIDEPSLEETKLFCMTPIRNHIQYFSNSSAVNAFSNLNFAPLGGGSITIAFDSSFPTDRRSYVSELFNTIYPEIVEVYGDPSNTITTTIKYDPTIYPWNYYDPGINTMALSNLPPSAGINPSFDNIFTHEMIHAFHDAIYIIPENSWAEEGMAEATTEIVAMNLKNKGIRNIVFRDMIINLKYYDVWSYAGLDFLGGTEYFFNRIDPDLSYRSAAAMFLILSNELSIDPLQPYGYLKRLNEELYQRGITYVPDSTFKIVVKDVAGGTLVEGMYADQWLGSQTITHTTGKLDSFLGIFPVRPENPSQIRVYAYERIIGAYGRVEEPISSVQVNVKIYDYSGGIAEEFSVVTNSEGMGEHTISTFPLQTGGYEVYASATVDGSNIFAKSFAFSQGLDSTIDDEDENIYGVILDLDGAPIHSSIDVVGGAIQSLEKAAFILKADDTFVPFEVTLTSGGHEKIVGKPNPYTRVIWTYATPTEPYSVTVNIDGLPSEYETNLYVDSSTLKTLNGGDTDVLNYESGMSHTISVDQYINVGSDSRYYCPTNIFTVTSDSVLNFTYHAEFLVIFEHDIPSTDLVIQVGDPLKGEETKNYGLPANFWWEAGSVHSYAYPSTVITGEGVQYVLNHTSIDSPVTVDSSLTIIGHYSKELVIITAYSIGQGAEISVTFTLDGAPHTTPYEFSDFGNNPTIIMPSEDDVGEPFLKWSDSNSTSPSRVISSAGIYQAVYGLAEPDFTLTLSPKEQRIAPGSYALYIVTLDSLNGFDSSVTFSIAGLPFNSSGTFDPPSIVPPGNVTLRVDIWRAALVGHYRFIVNGVGGGKVHSTEIDLSLGACVIATSTYGSEISPEVNLLRTFRDEYVLQTFAGEQFMMAFNSWYYSFSPQLAEMISQNIVLKEITRIVLYPLIYALTVSSLAYDSLSFNSELAIFVSGFITSILISMAYLLPILLILNFIFRKKHDYGIHRGTLVSSFLLLSSSVGFAIMAEFLEAERLMMFSAVIFIFSSICFSATFSAHRLKYYLSKRYR